MNYIEADIYRDWLLGYFTKEGQEHLFKINKQNNCFHDFKLGNYRCYKCGIDKSHLWQNGYALDL